MAKKFMDEGESPKQDLIEAIHPYAKNATLLHVVGRVILMLISIKRPSVCRYYLYYELLLHIINICSPFGLSFEIENQRMLMFALVNFGTYSFDWWPNLFT